MYTEHARRLAMRKKVTVVHKFTRKQVTDNDQDYQLKVIQYTR